MTPARYLETTGRPDRFSGGARLIPITTPKGEFKVWTKRVGNNPSLKLLLLHGGPGATQTRFPLGCLVYKVPWEGESSSAGWAASRGWE